jgi:hypothetical protein
MNINKLLKLFYDTGFLDGDKLKRIMPKITEVKKVLESLYNGNACPVFRHYSAYKDGEMKAHISRIHLWDGAWLCQHHVGSGGYGMKVLGEMIRDSIAYNTEGIEYFCALYQPIKSFPNAIFGDVYREVVEQERGTNELISETPYGYAYLTPAGNGPGLSQRTVMTDRQDNKHWPVLKHSVKQILGGQSGTVYHNYSAPGINFSSYTNSTILHLTRPVTLDDISTFIREDAPVMWTPLKYLLDVEPEKIYHFWQAKIDKRLWKYFKALDNFS